jgi:hypothetical protein
VGRDDASHLRESENDADIERRQADAFEIQPEERRERAEVSEVEEVETGESPVKKRGQGRFSGIDSIT